jgi:dihydroflavonol-4-reductase
MKVFITGATGLVGSFVTEELLANGHDVTAIKRTNTNLFVSQESTSQITWFDADILDPLGLEKAMQGADAIIHAAAMVSFNRRDREQMMKINIEGTANVVNLALKLNIKRFIHVSSIASFGKDKLTELVTEDSNWKESSSNTAYAESKYLSELEVWRGHTEGLSVAIINPSVILGPQDWDKSSTRLFKYVWNQNRFYTQGFINYVDVRDVTEVCLKLLLSDINGRRYILSAGQVSYKEFFEAIAHAMQRRPPHILITGVWMKVLATLESVRSTLMGSEPLITKETARMADKKYNYSSERAQQELNHKFRNLEETISWTCHVLKQKIERKSK